MPQDKRNMLAKYALAKVVEKVMFFYILEAYPKVRAWVSLGELEELECVYKKDINKLVYGAWGMFEEYIKYGYIPSFETALASDNWPHKLALAKLLTEGENLFTMYNGCNSRE